MQFTRNEIQWVWCFNHISIDTIVSILTNRVTSSIQKSDSGAIWTVEIAQLCKYCLELHFESLHLQCGAFFVKSFIIHIAEVAQGPEFEGGGEGGNQ